MSEEDINNSLSRNKDRAMSFMSENYNKVNELRKKVSFIVKDIDEEFSMHDFRIVRAINYTNLIFEVAVPFETKLSDAEIEKLIKTRIKQIGKEYRPVIIVEKQGF